MIAHKYHRMLTGAILSFTFALMSCSDSEDHTAANNEVALVDCTTITPGADLADDFACAHNLHRVSVPANQPVPNPPLAMMSWNPSLADWAQAHVNKCDFQHSDGSARATAFGEAIGENLYAATGTIVTAETVLQSWVSEAADYDYTSNSCNGTCGHYTQIVWRDSIEVGCAVVYCTTLNGAFSNATFVVCNYKAAGNFVGEKPY